jgi:hypothetical protein
MASLSSLARHLLWRINLLAHSSRSSPLPPPLYNAASKAMTSLKFTVRRKPAALVPPEEPTPRELKRLSDIDDQDGLRFHIPVIQFYRRSELMSTWDLALVIRDAVARALVPYWARNRASGVHRGPERSCRRSLS